MCHWTINENTCPTCGSRVEVSREMAHCDAVQSDPTANACYYMSVADHYNQTRHKCYACKSANK